MGRLRPRERVLVPTLQEPARASLSETLHCPKNSLRCWSCAPKGSPSSEQDWLRGRAGRAACALQMSTELGSL